MIGPLRIGFAGAGTIARDRHVPGFRAIPDVAVGRRGEPIGGVESRRRGRVRLRAHGAGLARAGRGPRPRCDRDRHVAVPPRRDHRGRACRGQARPSPGAHGDERGRGAAHGGRGRAAARRHGLATLLVPASHTYWVDATITRLLADGAIGTLRTFDGAWNEPDVSDPGEWWRHQRRFSGNNVQGIGPLYEVLLRWLPAPAVAVTARTDLYEPRKPGPDGPIAADNPDHASILLEYADGTAGSLEVSSHSAARGPSTITLVGSEGALRVDLRARTLERQGRGRRLDAGAIDPADVEEWDVEAEFVGAVRGEREVRRNPFEVGLSTWRSRTPSSNRPRPAHARRSSQARGAASPAAPKATAEETQ